MTSPHPTRRSQSARPPVVAIDGPSGAGKSTVARRVAERLGVPYVDTGAMYRAAGVLAVDAGIRPPFGSDDGRRVAEEIARRPIELELAQGPARVRAGGADLSERIRTEEAAAVASEVSALPEVRRALVAAQRRLVAVSGGVVEGRDIGTVVLPDADLKVFLTADLDERARRRRDELLGRGLATDLEAVREQQRLRDERDRSRADSPLRRADDAVVIDATMLGIEQVVGEVVDRLATDRTGGWPHPPRRA